MPYEFIPVTLGITFILGLLGLGVLKKYLDTKNRLALREMIHKERLRALEKEAPLNDLTYDKELESEMALSGSKSNGTGILWLRLTSLCVGLTFLFGGIGMCIAFGAATDRDMHMIWPIGLIPLMVGFGLLLFWFLTRHVAKEME